MAKAPSSARHRLGRFGRWCLSHCCCGVSGDPFVSRASGAHAPFTGGCPPIEWLPEELLLRVLAQLDRPRDLLSCAGVNQRWRRLASDVSLWHTWPIALDSLATYTQFRQRWLCATGRQFILDYLGEVLLPPLASPRADVLFCWTRDSVRRDRAVPMLIHTGRGSVRQHDVWPLPAQLSDAVMDIGGRFRIFTDNYFALSEPVDVDDDRNITRLAVFRYIDAASSVRYTYSSVELRHSSRLRCSAELRAHCATHADSLVVFVQFEQVLAQLWDFTAFQEPANPQLLQLPAWFVSGQPKEFCLAACSLSAEYLTALNRASRTVLVWPRPARGGMPTTGLEPAALALRLPCEAQELGRVQLFVGQAGFLYISDRWSRTMFTTYWCRLPPRRTVAAVMADAEEEEEQDAIRLLPFGAVDVAAMRTLHLNELVHSDENSEESFVVCRECIIFGCSDGSIRMWDVLADCYK